MDANTLSTIAIGVSIISLCTTCCYEKRNLRIQLFKYRHDLFAIISEIDFMLHEHIDVLDVNNLSFIQDSNYIFELFVNTITFENVKAYAKTENYNDYISQTYQELLRIQQKAGSFTLMFKNNQYAQKAQALVTVYIEFLKALYRHSVFVNKCKKCNEKLPRLAANTEEHLKREIEEFEKNLKKEEVTELIENLLTKYREFIEIPVLDHLRTQIILSKP